MLDGLFIHPNCDSKQIHSERAKRNVRTFEFVSDGVLHFFLNSPFMTKLVTKLKTSSCGGGVRGYSPSGGTDMHGSGTSVNGEQRGRWGFWEVEGVGMAIGRRGENHTSEVRSGTL